MPLPWDGATIRTYILISQPLASDAKDYIAAATMTISRVGFHANSR